MNDIMDMKISGSSAMPGGEYRLVSISGSGKVQGSLRCESLRCSGSARVHTKTAEVIAMKNGTNPQPPLLSLLSVSAFFPRSLLLFC